MCNVLVLCPHTDDEIACAGTIARHIKDGDSVRVLAFSTGNRDTGASAGEFVKSMMRLGIENYHLYAFVTRLFFQKRQQILQKLCNESKPDIVYCPCDWDIHQDHQVITQEAIRAFKTCTIYGYEVWQNGVIGQNVNHYVEIEERHLHLKAGLMRCYQTQNKRAYMNIEIVESLSRLRGLQVAVQFAEAFQTIRSIRKCRENNL